MSMNGFYKLNSIHIVDENILIYCINEQQHVHLHIWYFVVNAWTKRWGRNGDAISSMFVFCRREKKKEIYRHFFSRNEKKRKKRQITLESEMFMIDTSKWFIRVRNFKGLKWQIFAPVNRIINCFWCEHLLQTDNKIGPFPFSTYFQWPYLRVDIWYLCLLCETYPIFCCCCSALSRPNTIHQIYTDEWLAFWIPEGMRANWFYRFIPLSKVHAKKKHEPDMEFGELIAFIFHGHRIRNNLQSFFWQYYKKKNRSVLLCSV